MLLFFVLPRLFERSGKDDEKVRGEEERGRVALSSGKELRAWMVGLRSMGNGLLERRRVYRAVKKNSTFKRRQRTKEEKGRIDASTFRLTWKETSP